MKKFAILALVSLVAACSATQEEQEFDMRKVQSKLPDGCELHYAGSVRTKGSKYSSKVFYTTCGAATTTTENHTQRSGKVTYQESSVNVSVEQP